MLRFLDRAVRIILTVGQRSPAPGSRVVGTLRRSEVGEHYPLICDEPTIRTPPPSKMSGFEDLYWLFSCGAHNRSIARIDLDEAALLFRAVRRSRGPCLEIGRRHGGSTVIMHVAAEGRQLVSIDFEPNHFPSCERVFSDPRYSRNLTLLVCNSREPLRGATFGFAFIDGDHSYEGLRADIRAHWPSLQAHEGLPPTCAFHDVDAAKLDVPPTADDLSSVTPIVTVTAAVHSLLKTGCARVVECAGTMVVVEKTREIPPGF